MGYPGVVRWRRDFPFLSRVAQDVLLFGSTETVLCKAMTYLFPGNCYTSPVILELDTWQV